MANNAATISTNDVYVGESNSVVLTEYLEELENEVANKAQNGHSHTDIVEAVEALDTAVSALEDAISSIQNGGGSASVEPMLVASMHLGKLDNNSGAENSSSTRICSEPFAVSPGNSYYQVNDKGVNMYVLIYDADELFVEYMGSFASGAEISVTNPNASYMRLGSLLGEYDLTNEFRIYDIDPESSESPSGGAAVDAYNKNESDERYAPKNHTHENDHAHNNKDVLDGITAEKVAAWDAGTNSNGGSGYVHPNTHPASMITGLADVATTGNYNDLKNKPTIPTIPQSLPANGGNADTVGGKSASDFAASTHTHSGYAASNHTHSGYASSSHDHDDNYAAKSHTHHPANIGALSSSGGTISGALTVMLDSIFNGVLNTQKIQPKDSGSYSIGTADNRYYSTYLRTNPNVSSDRRCKRDIAALDAAALAEFVNKLPVVSYNYNDDAADEEKRIGVIAQDVISADPEIARFFVEQDSKGFYSLRPADFVFILIAAVQQISARVAMLEGK